MSNFGQTSGWMDDDGDTKINGLSDDKTVKTQI